MTNENGVKVLTDMVADFVAHIGKKLPDDVVAKLEELGSQETAALPKALYETMTKNQKLAVELNRPSCQDTGVLQFWLKCGTNFPYPAFHIFAARFGQLAANVRSNPLDVALQQADVLENKVINPLQHIIRRIARRRDTVGIVDPSAAYRSDLYDLAGNIK